jgi:intergrase/recombinase
MDKFEKVKNRIRRIIAVCAKHGNDKDYYLYICKELVKRKDEDGMDFFISHGEEIYMRNYIKKHKG